MRMPESGMGYQIVDISLQDGRAMRRVTIFDGEIVELPAGYENVSENDITDVVLSG
ncbi:MAG: hypothetical protein Q7S09_04070 [bacterium]|nr:hypothetical protein [bacterium]